MENKKVYGYCRISTSRQNIDRQVRNILEASEDVIIVQEIFTGTKIEGRKELEKLLIKVKEGDTIIFDSVSRFSRDSKEGFALYQDLYKKGINLEFIKEPHINTSVFKQASENQIKKLGTKEDILIDAINQYLLEIVKEQIKIAFNQTEKEVKDLQQRTKEGIQTAKINGKRVGRQIGDKPIYKKTLEAKEQILKHSTDFGGTLKDLEVIKLTGIGKTTYYRIKKELQKNKEI
ncbi:MAG: recombinase family protein [Peptostreptococcaceae bacterium]